MRKSFVALGSAAVAGSLLLAAPAMAAQPEVHKQSCDSQGGTFANDQGTKSCTTTTTLPVTTPILSTTSTTIPSYVPTALCQRGYISDGTCDIIPTGYYTSGTYYQNYIGSITTTSSQKGNGDVTTTSTTPVAVSPAQTVALSCTQAPVYPTTTGAAYAVPVSFCQNANLYP